MVQLIKTKREVSLMLEDTASQINSFEKIEKSGLKRIEISQLPKEIPNFKNIFESKDSVIKKWLIDWINVGIKKGDIKENSLLPKKADLAYHLGVSVGTVQNAIRYVEDSGLLESKQRIGTIVKTSSISNPIIKKASSKREKVIALIQKYIVENDLQVGDSLPSARKLSSLIGNSTNTIRLALDFLCSQEVLKINSLRLGDSSWVVNKIPSEFLDNVVVNGELSSETLVVKVEDELKSYIKDNFKVGDRLPAHKELSDILKVSIKTVHDAMKTLIEEGFLLARRGRYGTIITRVPGDNVLQPLNEVSIITDGIFAKAEDAAYYSYQKIENLLKTYIGENYEVGEKLPSMEKLSQKFDVSSNTIRKALQNLARLGYVDFSRGRYGGTFVIEKPENETQETFRWLAVSPNYTIVADN